MYAHRVGSVCVVQPRTVSVITLSRETRWLHILDNTYYHYHYYDSYYNYYSIAIIIIVFGRVTTLKSKKKTCHVYLCSLLQSDPIQTLYLLIYLLYIRFIN